MSFIKAIAKVPRRALSSSSSKWDGNINTNAFLLRKPTTPTCTTAPILSNHASRTTLSSGRGQGEGDSDVNQSTHSARQAPTLVIPPANPRTKLPHYLFALSLFLLLFLGTTGLLSAATLSDPLVDRYNVRVGTQTFAGLYQFTTNTLLVETAQAIQDLGCGVIKFYMGSDYPRQCHITLNPNVTNLLTLARDEPSCHKVLDMPFQHLIVWAYPFANSDAAWANGYSSTERANDYRELYDLTRYLLTNYNNSGKTFYLGHWEGDGYLTPWTTNAPPVTIQGMIDWLNNRQKAIDDAKHDSAFTNVNVFCYAEVNRVRDAMLNGPTNNIRVINAVIPYVTNLDCLSYSSYDAQNLGNTDLYATLDYIQSKLSTNKAAIFPGQRIWIGEYGHGASSTDAQEPMNRAYIQNLLNWGTSPRFILYWEMYDNETNRDFCLINSNNVKVASYYLHQRFLNQSRLMVAQFKERNGRLPVDSEFAPLVTPMLDQPLPTPTPLRVSNLTVRQINSSSASVSGSVAQGIYGDDQAALWVFWGRQDGGTVKANWEQSLRIGLNTNFNPVAISTVLSNLISNTNYYFRFYATNATAEAWAPASAQFSTETINPSAFACRMRIAISGYNRSEPLMNFPLLVNLSTSLPGFSYQQFASSSGADLRFTDATGTLVIPHEIDEWNPNGVSTIWVRVPSITDTNDYVWAYWSNPAANLPASSTNGSVWLPEHDLVWHLKESTFPYADATQQHPALSGTTPASTSAKIGRGCTFNGTSQYLNGGSVNLGNTFTLSAWVKIDPTATSIQTILANKSGGWNMNGFAFYVNSYQTTDQKLILETGNGTTGQNASTIANVVTPGQWHHVAAVVDELSGTARLFVDGTDYTQNNSVTTDFLNQGVINLGRFTNSSLYFKGAMDEVRIEAGTWSSNWIWSASMNATSSQTFVNYSSVNPRPVLSVGSLGNNATLTWPTSAGAVILYTTTNLAPSAIWTPVTNQPVLVEDQWQIQLPNIGTSSFYRLQYQ
jgi:Concanavalin A-like lectin/glucanases superfamily/Domain of unknown function (DUF2341)